MPAKNFLMEALFACRPVLQNGGRERKSEINKVDKWLRSNKLSLNYKRSFYLVINKFPQPSMDIDIEISINNIKLICSKYVKYLGLWLDDDLKFRTQI